MEVSEGRGSMGSGHGAWVEGPGTVPCPGQPGREGAWD